MSLSDPVDTLSYQNSRMLTTNSDIHDMTCAKMMERVKPYLSSVNPGIVKPEDEALCFYGLHHGMALLATEYAPLQPLRASDLEYVENYHACIGPKAVRAFVYLLLICTRESRHNKSLSADEKKLAGLYGQSIASFHKNTIGGEQGGHNALLTKSPTASLGAYVKSLQWVFYNSHWNNGYGGKAWGKVTDCLVRYVFGETTPEMMMDTVWTLAHNNGPIFNKGIVYGNYGKELAVILDVQRSGQIPEMVLSGVGHHVQKDLIDRMSWLKDRFRDRIGNSLDWGKVQKLGSVGKYTNTGTNAPPEKSSSWVKPAPTKILTSDQIALVAKHGMHELEIMPGVHIPLALIKR